MSRSRIAQIHRQIAALHDELAAEIERQQEAAPANDVRPKRRRSTPTPVVPDGVTDIEVRRAIDVARRRGIAVR